MNAGSTKDVTGERETHSQPLDRLELGVKLLRLEQAQGLARVLFRVKRQGRTVLRETATIGVNRIFLLQVPRIR